VYKVITKSAMEIDGGRGDREWAKVWKKREALANIE
jgi:hypothetical protein